MNEFDTDQLPWWSSGMVFTWNARDQGLIPQWGKFFFRSPIIPNLTHCYIKKRREVVFYFFTYPYCCDKMRKLFQKQVHPRLLENVLEEYQWLGAVANLYSQILDAPSPRSNLLHCRAVFDEIWPNNKLAPLLVLMPLFEKSWICHWDLISFCHHLNGLHL